MPKQTLTRLAAPILLITQLPACTGIGGVSGEMPLRIETQPSGATVYILDEALGVTPLEVTQNQLYPAAYDAGKAELYGKIVIRKPTCEAFSQRIKYQDFSKGLQVKLNCEDGAEQSKGSATVETAPAQQPSRQPVTAQPPEQQVKPVEPATAETQPANPSIKARLQRLENLRSEAVISEEEYRATRKRILNEL
ncbi:MAG: PEGA domain-containing protein [Candidatus Thiodiazotropha lotti]|uniref:PEGA domain-containing protein n=1 Tax=Candidatus Thiodiazotropha endoloripes TaxID=1818881 RepID=A0A1E2UP49_9GAMM|nr:PEGA domain-containing protein [Candidatus Thiodiazotropha endoloripes]MCG7899119.1 PEGA domain-containing protein [Candidatus Thiodiazotropha weberae]MCG7993335.1 PEGA domain-containing protein [Candidatus Thiodiazotropha lotti]MCG7903743.1 PEGA domain-containing protein [Candidatus Thiodiazotropha weberae]MCG7915243.1 PEGA domain-containing protein [Candidatus Thiodiazotropha weberae]MCG7998148.1 PEGA domain-containing protein [Candidatus Thiodiazotropha lotti]